MDNVTLETINKIDRLRGKVKRSKKTVNVTKIERDILLKSLELLTQAIKANSILKDEEENNSESQERTLAEENRTAVD